MASNFLDRIVQYPNRYTVVDNGDGTYTITPSPGTITQAGTPLNSTNINAITSDILATKGVANGLATLGADIKVPQVQCQNGVDLIYSSNLACTLTNIDIKKYSYIEVNCLGTASNDSSAIALSVNGTNIFTTSTSGYRSGKAFIQGNGNCISASQYGSSTSQSEGYVTAITNSPYVAKTVTINSGATNTITVTGQTGKTFVFGYY